MSNRRSTALAEVEPRPARTVQVLHCHTKQTLLRLFSLCAALCASSGVDCVSTIPRNSSQVGERSSKDPLHALPPTAEAILPVIAAPMRFQSNSAAVKGTRDLRAEVKK
jgi:hypothetical protein